MSLVFNRVLWRVLVLWFITAQAGHCCRAAEAAEGGWSAELLHQVLSAETPAPETPAPVATELVLHTYRLNSLRVGEAGKAQNVLAILGKLLPPGSSLNPDVPANSIHVLTTPDAHKAVWDYLSAVDTPEPAVPAAAVVPDEVKAALKRLTENGEQSRALSAAVSSLQTNVSGALAAIDERQKREVTKLAALAAGVGVMLVTALWLVFKRGARRTADTSKVAPVIAVAPDQLATALVPAQEKMRTDMLGLLNEVAIKLQAQHTEQQQLLQNQQQQLESARQELADERRQFISEANSMVVQAVERVDASTAKLARQQDKVAELVQELQNTVKELDDTKDSLRTREVELEKERAKIAALSLLLEEGHPVSDSMLPPLGPSGTLLDAAGPDKPTPDSPVTTFPFNPCTTVAQATVATVTAPNLLNGAAHQGLATPRFTFLPPILPEN